MGSSALGSPLASDLSQPPRIRARSSAVHSGQCASALSGGDSLGQEQKAEGSRDRVVGTGGQRDLGTWSPWAHWGAWLDAIVVGQREQAMTVCNVWGLAQATALCLADWSRVKPFEESLEDGLTKGSGGIWDK